VIRFSAGLVVVAIGVLIGGVATSKLSLVYVAIAVSAVALVVLAIGVALKRDELFGGGPELAPAGAGASSGTPAGQSVGAGDVRDKAGHVREDQQPIQSKKVPGPATAAFEAAAAAQAAAAAATVAAPTVTTPRVTTPPVASPTVASPTVGASTGGPAADNSPFGNPPLANRRAAFGQAAAHEGDSAADWQTRSPQPPWSSGDEVRPAWTPKEQVPVAAPPTVPQSGAASVSPSPSPRAWGSTDPSPAQATRAGSGTVAPSWFDRLNQPAAAPVTRVTPVASATLTGTDPAKAGPDEARPEQAEPEQAADPSDAGVTDVDTDDDWPTRYSWLEDDETDEASEPAETVEVPDGAGVADVAETVPDGATAAEPVAAEPGASEADSPHADAEAHVATAADVDTTADPADETAEPDQPLVVDAAHEDGDADEPADAPAAAQRSDSTLVTVIPGVPRYHDPDCILIRFMDEEDIARKSIPEAKAANCTPCAACQPEG
jgi:hypothetical protein